MFKIILSLLYSFLLVFGAKSSNYAFYIPGPTSEYYVNDFANIMEAKLKQQIINTSKKIEEIRDGTQIVITTVKTTNGQDYVDYANKMYDQYKIGKGDKGVLLLIVSDDKKVKIEVGYGLEGFLNDAKAGSVIDKSIVPYFKNSDWNTGIYEGYRDIVKIVANVEIPEFDLTNSDNHINEINDLNKSNKKAFIKILMWILPIIIVLMFCFPRMSRPVFFLLWTIFNLILDIIGISRFGGFGDDDSWGSNNDRRSGRGGKSGGGGAGRSF